MSFTFGYYIYTDDQGVQWNARIRSDVASQLSLSTTRRPTIQVWDKSPSGLRHRWFVNQNAPFNRIRVPINIVTNPLFADGAVTISWTDGNTYDSMGKVGEKRLQIRVPK